jgi:DNA-binding CsgD family transcriptional regulator
MLVGRDEELRRLRRLLDRARSGAGGCIVIRGEPGVGKTELTEEVVRRAHGFQVTTARGVESESELAFAGLATLTRPCLGRIDELAPPQRRAISSALALSDEPTGSAHAVYLAFLSLLALAADEHPQLIVVDDLQWVDRPSTNAILFAARRLGADRVAMVLAMRPSEDGDRSNALGLPEVTLGGLEPEAARSLLTSEYPDMDGSVVSAVVKATAGVPLALLEVPRLLSEDQVRGREALADPVPVGTRVQDAFRRTLATLPPGCREALVVLAADERSAPAILLQALQQLGLAIDVLEPARHAAVIRDVADGVAFRHPLLRSAVYHGMPISIRRRAHLALANALGDDHVERRAWHLAFAASAPDEEVASTLVNAARAAGRKGAYASAVAAYERAAELTPDPGLRAWRFLDGAEACRLGGFPDRGISLLDRAMALAPASPVRAHIQLTRGRILFHHGSLPDAYAVFTKEARRIERELPEVAAKLLTEACWTCTGAADVPNGLRSAEHAYALSRIVGGPARATAALALAEAYLLIGRGRDARRILTACKAYLESRPSPFSPAFSPTIAMSYLVAGDYEFAGFLLNAQVAAARELGAPGLISFVIGSRVDYLFRTGEWTAAYADGTEALALARDVPSFSILAFVLTELARTEAGLGREDALNHATEGERLVARHGHHSLILCAQAARALLHLGAGRIDEAITELRQTDRLWDRSGARDPGVVQWMPDLVEAFARAGRFDEAWNILGKLDDQAEQSQSTWARAVAARGRGLLADVEFESHLTEALALHATEPTPFEEARTELVFGERLRRAGRRAEARPHLRAALATFHRLGARDWARRAEVELGGSVEHAERGRPASDHLSPHELQIALQVAGGATNAEAAAALFVTRKTVEFHLRNVYRKLGIRSRTELAALMAAQRSVRPAHRDRADISATELPLDS